MTAPDNKLPEPMSKPRLGVRNMGTPIKLSGVEIHGVSTTSAREGENVRVLTSLAMTSDDVRFHPIVENLGRAVLHLAQAAGSGVALDRAHTVLMVVRPDKTAELWVDAAAVSVTVMMKRSITGGSFVMESDVADIQEMSFPCVEIGPEDGVLCLFREGWKFGLYFDFNLRKALDLSEFHRSLGTLLRNLRYRQHYQFVGNEGLRQRLTQQGWFPFAEIIGHEFEELMNHVHSGWPVEDAEPALLVKFDTSRLKRILERWLVKPEFASRESLLRAAIDAYIEDKPIATIKILLTEIEGVLRDAHIAKRGESAKLKKLLEFVVDAAKSRAGGDDTLLFPNAFGEYLQLHTFGAFDPMTGAGNAGSRHAVGHGAAQPASYTKVRALQAILALDQIAFCM